MHWENCVIAVTHWADLVPPQWGGTYSGQRVSDPYLPDASRTLLDLAGKDGWELSVVIPAKTDLGAEQFLMFLKRPCGS